MDDDVRQDASADCAPVFQPAVTGGGYSEADRRDAEIALSARNLLKSDKFLLEGSVPNVAVRDGWVTLWGEVSRSYKRQPATRAVFRLPGVNGVCDQIAVMSRVELAGET
jgi:osmotically-inducible protein OsmY